MENIQIQYRFKLAENTLELFSLRLDANRLELIDNIPNSLPGWTRLDFHQCPNCPLVPASHPNCPLSANLVDIVTRFESVLSYDRVHVDVLTDDRCVSMNCSAQKGISSLMGLVIATSGCPHTVFFKPMARFHHPLANEEETLFRAVGTYLLAQYLLKAEGKKANFEIEGLNQIYTNMQLVNAGIAERLKSACESDLSPNAIMLLDLFAIVIPHFVQDSLKNIRYLFEPYLAETAKAVF